jgi:hypothetical protein
MAIFHLNAKVISRGKAQSAIAAAAYRSGERLRDEQANRQKFYTAGAERIQSTFIMAPKDAPAWAYDRNQLWNRAEQAEKRKDSQLAREIEVSLPHELTPQQREWLVKDFAREAFVRRGYAVDIAIHAPHVGKDDRNFHAHIMITMRTLGPEGFAAKKDPAMNKREQLGEWRQQWANLANRHLERHGHEARIDHRSLEAQGSDREPTMHLGYAAKEIAQRGAPSDRMDAFRDILARNEIRLDLKAVTKELQGLEEEQAALQKRQAAETEKLRLEAVRSLQRADRADLKALDRPAEQAFGENARAVAQDIRNERRETLQNAQQEAWRQHVAEHAPQPGKGRDADRGGISVTYGATGVVSRLGDFVAGLLAGATPQPTSRRDAAADMRSFVTDPAARREQQLARVAAIRAAQADQKARERMHDDMQAGRSLRAADVRLLTHEHLMQLSLRGDDAMRDMVAEARKSREGASRGEERERDR